jgi:hypothetical protein
MFARRLAPSSNETTDWSDNQSSDRRWTRVVRVSFLDLYLRSLGVSEGSRAIWHLLGEVNYGEVNYAEKARFRSLLLRSELWSIHSHPEIVGAHEQRILNILRVWGRRESRRQSEICTYCFCGCTLACSRTRYYDAPIRPRQPLLSLFQIHWKLLQISSSKQQLGPAVLDELRFPKGAEDASVLSKTINGLTTAVPPRAREWLLLSSHSDSRLRAIYSH